MDKNFLKNLRNGEVVEFEYTTIEDREEIKKRAIGFVIDTSNREVRVQLLSDEDSGLKAFNSMPIDIYKKQIINYTYNGKIKCRT